MQDKSDPAHAAISQLARQAERAGERAAGGGGGGVRLLSSGLAQRTSQKIHKRVWIAAGGWTAAAVDPWGCVSLPCKL